MKIEIVQESAEHLAEYARIPIAFEMRGVMKATRVGDRYNLEEHRVALPRVKDYDALPGEGPTSWPERFDLSRWQFFAARHAGERVGGAAVVARSPGIDLLEGRPDLGLLWDIRVAPSARGQGIGTALIQAAENWAAAQALRTMKVETQDVNAPACRFYERSGYKLRSITPRAYRDFPDETQLLWYKELPRVGAGPTSD